MTSTFQYTRTKSLLTVDDVHVSFGKTPIIKGFSATVQDVIRPGMSQGQIIGLLGPSGIGKTTLFRVIAGLLQPNSGSVTKGENNDPIKPGDVGVVTQSYLLLQHRTVQGNLVFAAMQAGMTRKLAEESTKQILADFGLQGHEKKYPIQLSGGQRQRVAIAQQLICGCTNIIMDEPFSGLDVVALTNARKVITDTALKNEENTFIIVTHDVTSAVAISDTIWLMGRDRDENNNIIPGAKLMDIIDLIDLDIAWHDHNIDLPQSISLIRQIKERFLTL